MTWASLLLNVNKSGSSCMTLIKVSFENIKLSCNISDKVVVLLLMVLPLMCHVLIGREAGWKVSFSLHFDWLFVDCLLRVLRVRWNYKQQYLDTSICHSVSWLFAARARHSSAYALFQATGPQRTSGLFMLCLGLLSTMQLWANGRCRSSDCLIMKHC